MSSLELDVRSRDKLIKLANERYDPATDILTLKSGRYDYFRFYINYFIFNYFFVLFLNRCPYRQQNIDYVKYLLDVLFIESWVKFFLFFKFFFYGLINDSFCVVFLVNRKLKHGNQKFVKMIGRDIIGRKVNRNKIFMILY
jgi:hypothetical protein